MGEFEPDGHQDKTSDFELSAPVPEHEEIFFNELLDNLENRPQKVQRQQMQILMPSRYKERLDALSHKWKIQKVDILYFLLSRTVRALENPSPEIYQKLLAHRDKVTTRIEQGKRQRARFLGYGEGEEPPPRNKYLERSRKKDT